MEKPKFAISAFVLIVSIMFLGVGQVAAQGSGDTTGPYSLQIATTNDFSFTSTGFDFDLLTRFKMGMLSAFSWGRGATVPPGLLRSSNVVLRERRGLMLR